MQIEHSKYWERKKGFRPEISDDLIEYAIQNSDTLKDRNWEGLFNAIARLPSTGRKLKVVYRRKGKNKFDIGAYFNPPHSSASDAQRWQASFQQQFGIPVPSALGLLGWAQGALEAAQQKYGGLGRA